MKSVRSFLVIQVVLMFAVGCSYTAERKESTNKQFLREEIVSNQIDKSLLLRIESKPTAVSPYLGGTTKGAETEFENVVNIYQEIDKIKMATSTLGAGTNILIWTLGWVVVAPLWAYASYQDDMKKESNWRLSSSPGSYNSTGKGSLVTNVYYNSKPGNIVKDSQSFKRKKQGGLYREFPADNSKVTLKCQNFPDLVVELQVDSGGKFSVDTTGLLNQIFTRQSGKPLGTSLAVSASHGSLGSANTVIQLTDKEVIDVVTNGKVDWSGGKASGIPYPVANVEMITTGTIGSGEEVRLRLHVDNTTGKGDIYKLYAITNCSDDQRLSGKYILVGKVKTGEKKTVETVFVTGEELFDRNLKITFNFVELNDYVPQDQSLEFFVKAVNHADFAITTQVFDGQGGRGIGNGNGILEKREGPECQVAVRNTGNAPSGKTTVEVIGLPANNPDLVIFGQLKKELPGLGVGEVVTHSFDMSLKHKFTDDRIKFKVIVRETAFNIERSEDVEWVIGQETEKKILVVNKSVEVLDEKVQLYAGASKETDTIGYLPKGTKILAKAWLGDFYQVELGGGQIAWIDTSKVQEVIKESEADTSKVVPPNIVFESDNIPMIAVTSPKNGYITDTKRIKIEGFARDDKGLKNISILINGSKVKETALNGSKITFAEDVELLSDGLNKVEVIVEDIKGQKDLMPLEISYFGKFPILKGFYKNIWAVIIGVDQYKDRTIPELRYAVRDAKGIESLVKEHLISGKVLTLYNADATRDNILKLLQGELAEVDEESAVFVYIACHGKTFETSKGPLGDLVPYDGSFSERERYKNISMQIFKDDIAKQIKAKHMLFVVDACYGGVLTRGVGIKKEDVDLLRTDSYLSDVKSKEAKIVMTAGADSEQVLDKGFEGHSVFTGRLIEVLRTSSHFVSSKELFSQVKWKVEEDAARVSHKQTPQYGYWWGDGDFIFIKK
ncbi:MAG: caspase family protein [Planctomycetes bacterium]|nr:caspase family protein [Planctomycetota bacterium]